MRQGYKRWDKAATSGYEQIRRLAHEYLLPALERCAVVVSRLRGLSKYQKSGNVLGLSTRALNNVSDIIDCLNLLGHEILNISGIELRQFVAFSSWLRHEIDLQSFDPASSSEDPAEKDGDIDYAKVLGYIQGPMVNSKLNQLLQETSPVVSSTTSFEEHESPLYDSFRLNFSRSRSRDTFNSTLLNLGKLYSYLERRCHDVFKQIAEAQKRNVLVGVMLPLTSSQDVTAVDMKMIQEVIGCNHLHHEAQQVTGSRGITNVPRILL